MYGKEREPICFACASVFDKKLLEKGRHSFTPPVKFKCVGRHCEKKLTFRQIVEGKCCPDATFALSIGTSPSNSLKNTLEETSAHLNGFYQRLKNQADKCKKELHRARSIFGGTKKDLEEAIQAHENSTGKFEKAEAAYKASQQQENDFFFTHF